MTPRPAPSTTLATGLVVAIATLPLLDVFVDRAWTISVIGAALAAAVVASIAETLRRDLPVSAMAGLTVVGALGWALLVPLRSVFFRDPVARAPLRELRDGLFGGWGSLLEEQFPLTDPLGAEVFAAVVVWIAAASAIHVAVRRRTALAAMGAGAVVLGISTAAALPRGVSPGFVGAGVAMIALLAVSTLTSARDIRLRPRRVVTLLGFVAVAGLAATALGSAADSLERDPFDPRASRRTEVIDLDVPDILAEFGVRREDPDPVMTVEGAESVSPMRLRLQVYDSHDGERWLPATGFEEIPTFPQPEVLPPGDVVNLSISIEALDGPWLPLPDRLTRTNIADIRWHAESQTALLNAPLSDLAVTGTVVSGAGLEGLNIDRGAAPERLGELPPNIPELIGREALAVTADADDSVSAIDAITVRLRELGRDEAVAPGHSVGRLRDDLVAGTATGAEQIASLHALMLRAIGVPSRVVVGYVVAAPSVLPGDLHVWTEAPFPGIGWVAFDPVPRITEAGPDATDDPTTPTTAPPEGTALEARALPRELGPGEDPNETEIGANRDLGPVDVLVLALLGLTSVLAAMVLSRSIRRRARRSRGRGADVRVLGAWAELIDRLRESGAPIASTTTIDDIGYMSTAMDSELGDHVRQVGELASIARYSPDETQPEQATEAWAALFEAEARLIEVAGRRTIVLRHIDPRVLRYRAPKPPPSRDGGRRGILRQH